MLDEVHERGRNIDISIGYLSHNLKKINDIATKVILCSATVD
jgi:HrpA-like RNA helicase